MGKKLKTGKQRKDKYYRLAKEAGYRSRAAFKLIQLNKRFEFLQRSRTLVDLCAAPGGWLQVASQNMPVSSVCIGVDLVPIKALKNCVTLQGDITTEKTRQMIKKELQTWDADCVLHDGAPNVGLNWVHDAFQQNCLVLSALKLATGILAKNGVFVTKIFRSNDYQSLVDVFEKLFKKVHVWKPAASRLESAEIFVVCEKYLKPAKVNPDLVDPRKVFSGTSVEVKAPNPQLLLHPRKHERKPKAEGYEENTLSVYKVVTASEFINSGKHLEILSTANKIILDDNKYEEHEATTEEIRFCIDDIKVCGIKELRQILAWRKKILKTLVKMEDSQSKSASDVVMEVEEDPDCFLQKKSHFQAVLKKKKKILLKEKAKALTRKKLGMEEGGDLAEINTEQELFSLSKLRKAKDSYAYKVEDSGTESTLSEEEYLESDLAFMRGDSDIENSLRHTEDVAFSKEDKRQKRVNSWFSRVSSFRIRNFFLKEQKLSPELLALGEQLIYSTKTRREVEDWSWNRYTNNDEDLPDWFVEDEKKHYRKELPVTKEQVQRYKERMKELNVKPIKKVSIFNVCR
ncbi:unnamed protein product [Enterobius vermicularis]|uniref:rRNA methyltransferase n=1 Tax=Enterobius vermicularis TaxID=51028 RepID=A0A0N4UWB4_ENTVE|nr:unnamed protein product [Enterobius vermicularis]